MVSVTRIVQGNTRLLRSAVVLAALVMLVLTGCHTTSGFGQDLQSVGRDIQKNADKK